MKTAFFSEFVASNSNLGPIFTTNTRPSSVER